jgi:hypothetical protein
MPSYGRTQEIEHEIGSGGSFSLSVTSADVRLIGSPGNAVRVSATFEIHAGADADADQFFKEYSLRVESAPGSLAVSDRHDGHRGFGGISRFFGADTVELQDVEVEAPAGCRLEIRTVNGDLQASGFQGAQRFQSVSGDLRLVEGSGDLDIDSVSGDVTLRAVGAVSLKMNNVSGDLSAEAPSYERLRAQSVSGDISVDGQLAEGTTHSVETVSGDCRLALAGGATIDVRGLSSDVRSSLPHRIEGTSDRRRLTVGDGTASVAFNSMSGDLSVVPSRQAPSEPAPSARTAPAKMAKPAARGDQRIEILGALERGEIDVDEAMRQLGGK